MTRRAPRWPIISLPFPIPSPPGKMVSFGILRPFIARRIEKKWKRVHVYIMLTVEVFFATQELARHRRKRKQLPYQIEN